MSLPCKPYPMQHQWRQNGQWLLVRPEAVGGLSCAATYSLDRLTYTTKPGLQVSSCPASAGLFYSDSFVFDKTVTADMNEDSETDDTHTARPADFAVLRGKKLSF